ncbi:DNA helicase II [Candidatus Nanosynbacter lyticus]|uniref:DNA 3'-5' helicase n=1 Tax=Candidatus Nanosynbacter lyticus TaxID=2093824 RepID=A0A6S4GTC9_9BACT|nr:UvrD-helicase domain-containing protein [Candidatus Nanosynbacter lyticus]AJA06584.1 DNA helicase II [Candidatus Nanosynbacter lyticus]QCT41698.1 ATP-dependent DNA helicase PcrA [TM7 phylum sp. oral taxon 952]
MTNFTDGLNDEQARAVTHGDGPLLILAGAGSGKTKTLTHRIAYLIGELKVFPSRILAVTFTNKAAKEMRQRLAQLLSENADNRQFMPWMGTFHSICVRILRMDGASIGLDRRFLIYDTDDQVSLMKQIMKARGLTDKDIKPRAVLSVISNAKNEMRSAEDFSMSARGPREQKIAELFFAYEKSLKEVAALDFDDLLIKTVELLRSKSDIRQKWQRQFEYILIDEYQDTNAVQYALIKLLVNERRNLCVVGDDAQSIYSFRGADYTNILNFERDFPGTTVVKLEQNYRSTGAILNMANSLISHNIHRTDKNLWTANGDGVDPKLWQLYSESEEAIAIANEIQAQIANGRQYGDVAVLYRTNAQSYAIERALRQSYVPYKIVGGLRFLDRAVIKDVLAYLRLLYQPSDRVSFLRIVNTPKRGIGAVSMAKFLEWNAASGRDIIGGLLAVEEADNLTARAKRPLLELGKILEELQREIDGSPAELIEKIMKQTGYGDFINDGTPQADERMENTGVLVAEAKAYVDVATFLEEMALMSSADTTADQQVTLMTLHAAKGLEFPVVFLAGLEEGILPHARVFDSGKADDIEEERRLCYVGVTRAREELFVSCANSRTQFGQIGYNVPSRFLDEMGLLAGGVDKPAQPMIEPEFYAEDIGLEVGDRVRSPSFGSGEIIDSEGLGVTVKFDDGNIKKLNVEFARLEKI